MNSRIASCVTALLGTLLLTFSVTASAQRALVEGKDYRTVKPVQIVETAGKVEVIEFFWYGCPHCNSLEPTLNQWIQRQGPDVAVRRVPVAYNDALVPHQRLFYALEALGKENDLRAKVFHSIHVEKNPLNRQELMADFAVKNGIDRKIFLDTYNSFAVQAKTRRASQIAEGYGVDGVPLVAVNGKYLISNSPALVSTIDTLVTRERSQVKR